MNAITKISYHNNASAILLNNMRYLLIICFIFLTGCGENSKSVKICTITPYNEAPSA